jgi:vacuolar protein sorting-associated protein 13B
VSLWGGDVVLKNLELRLDVIESELGIALQRGCIRKLTLHVPWNALSTKPGACVTTA